VRQGWSGRVAKKKNPCTSRESNNTSRPALSLVTTLTELDRPYFMKQN